MYKRKTLDNTDDILSSSEIVEIGESSIKKVKLDKGTFAEPTLSFETGGDTGLFIDGSSIGLAKGGAHLCTFDSTGIIPASSYNVGSIAKPITNVYANNASLSTLETTSDLNVGGDLNVAGDITNGSTEKIHFDALAMDFEVFNTKQLGLRGDGVDIPNSLNVGGYIRASGGYDIAPSYSFDDDRNTGMYKVTDDTLGFSCGGSTKLTLLPASAAITNNLSIGGSITGVGSITTSGNIILPSGTDTTPAVRFSIDPNTGIYRSGAGSVGISCGGARKFEVSSTGSTSAKVLNIEHQGGASQLVLKRSTAADGGVFKCEDNSSTVGRGTGGVDDLTIQSQGGANYINIEPNGGICKFSGTSPGEAAIHLYGWDGTNYRQCFQVGSINAAAESYSRMRNRCEGNPLFPSYSFLNKYDTGLYLADTSTLGFSCDGAKQVDISTTKTTLAKPLKLTQGSAPTPTTDTLYNVSGNLYWNAVKLNNTVTATNTFSSTAYTFGAGDIRDGSANYFTGVTGGGSGLTTSGTAYSTWTQSNFEISWTGKGSTSGDIILTGFSSQTTSSNPVPVIIGYAEGITVTGRLVAEVVAGNDYMYFYDCLDNGTAPTRLTAANFSTAGKFRCSMSYIVTYH